MAKPGWASQGHQDECPKMLFIEHKPGKISKPGFVHLDTVAFLLDHKRFYSLYSDQI